jgi:sulfite reductase beta subunit-like hemoprotein
MPAATTMSAISAFSASTRQGKENYQITLGGDGTETATIGERTGPGFDAEDLVPAIEAIVETYLNCARTPPKPSCRLTAVSARTRSSRRSTAKRRSPCSMSA